MKVELNHLSIIRNILRRYPRTFYAFGSRVHGQPKKFSDLDLCFMEPMSSSEFAALEEDFELSDLPYKVDLVDWQGCDSKFRDIILKNKEVLQACS